MYACGKDTAFFTMQRRILAWAACAAVSLGLEGAQVFFAERFPSATDLVLNAAGAALAVSVLSYTWPCAVPVGMQAPPGRGQA